MIDIRNFPKSGVLDFFGEISINLPADFGCGIQLVPVIYKGTILKEQSNYHLSAECSCKIIADCDRCLTETQFVFDFQIAESFSENSNSNENFDGDDEYIAISDKKIEITNLIQENLYAALPMKILCKEDCKGLCFDCGSNLNKSDCFCEESAANDFFIKALSIFSKDNPESH